MMSVMPAYIVAAAVLAAPIGQWSTEVGSNDSRTQVPLGRDISILTSLIPADMSATILVPNLSQLGRHIVTTKLLGHQYKDPYQSLKATLEIVDGIDDTGAGAIGIMGESSSADLWQNMVLWLPVTNPAAIMTFMQPKSISRGIYHVTIAGQASFAAEQGDFLLLSPRLEVINACLKSRASIRPRLSAYQQRMLSEVDLALVMSPANFLISGSNAWGMHWLATWLDLPDSTSQVPVGTLKIKPSGLEIAIVGYKQREIHAGRMGNTLARSTIGVTDLLLALPSASTVAAVGFEPSSAILASSGFVDLLFAYFQQNGIVNTQAAQELLRRLKHSMSRASVGSIALQSPRSDMKKFRATLILHTKGQAAIIRAEFQSMVSQLKRGFFKNPLWQRLADRLQISSVATMHEGVRIDHLSLSGLNGANAAVSSLPPGLFSTDGIVARMVVIDDEAFVLLVGGDEQDVRDVIKRWRAHQTPLSTNATIVSYAATRRSPVSAEGYISSDGWQRLTDSITKKGDSVVETGEASWITFSSMNVEVGVERFEMFLPYGWLDLLMQQNNSRE